MTLQETIRKVLKENLDDKIINMVNSLGIMTASKFVGGYKKLFKILDKYGVTKDMQIKLIKDYIGNRDGLGLYEINLADILFKEVNDEAHFVVYLEKDGALIQIWSGYDNDTDGGEYKINYEELPDNVIDEIYDVIIFDIINDEDYV
jgi:hypothetical protein